MNSVTRECHLHPFEEAVAQVVQPHRALNAQQLQHSTITAVEEFRGDVEQHDNVTIVVAKSR